MFSHCILVLTFIALNKASDIELLKSIIDSVEYVKQSKEVYAAPKTSSSPFEICYGDLGCFSKNGTFKHMKWLPESPKKIGTKFALYTRINHDLPVYLNYDDEESLKTHFFKPDRPTKFICHGFTQSGQSQVFIDMKNALLEVEDVNVIIVDWNRGAALPFYLSAAVNTEVVGRQLAKLIYKLKYVRELSGENIHIIGYSLGCHLAGFTGKTLRDKMGIILERITGLDPASPLFEDADESVHLSYKDASYVDVIHTSAGDSITSGDLGITKPIGHVDFYPNGGKRQPGCDKLVCSHRRAGQLFIQSILDNCNFLAYPCEDGYKGFQDGKCFNCKNNCGRMGYYSNPSQARGSLYLVTRGFQPFCGKMVRVSVISSMHQKTTYGEVEVILGGQHNMEDVIALTKSKDHTIDSGSKLGDLISVHEAVFPLKTVKLMYKKYRGWFSDGSHTWSIDSVTLSDVNGIIFSYCSPNTTLISDETIVLQEKECKL
ncbi:pancreatic lipase-related protein 2-like [Centruroides sculpturatus]|uniref:pancreatic lipase-related protein 2-like n=1 Tax=Centruroides sculpturatus TaxID=218467 RepID=UPI000C6EABDF|nr:pancreatic lipase-related protein 2-like [Centruroides sculpturatus]